MLGTEHAVEFRVTESEDSSSSKLNRSRPTVASSHPGDGTPSLALVSANPTVEQRRAAGPATTGPATTGPRRGRPNGYVPKRKFASLDTLVVGKPNKFAVNSARLIAEDLGKVSPFFVWGPTGVGKTHLLEGVWSHVRKSSDHRRCVYLTAEQFTTFFLDALHGRGLPSFRRRYRDVDLLIIEDVQFFHGKKATINELLYTMDDLQRDGRQVVFSANCSPRDLEKLGSDLVARFSGGLVAELGAPDFEMKKEIIKRGAAQRALVLPNSVVQLIAEHVTDDVRRLSGALNRLHAFSQVWACPLTAEVVQEALGELMERRVSTVQLGDIERAVCDVFGVQPQQLKSSARARKLAEPRMLAMWLAREYTRAALSEIGEFFGRRSHSTVVSAEKRVNQWRQEDAIVRAAEGDYEINDAIRTIELKLKAS